MLSNNDFDYLEKKTNQKKYKATNKFQQVFDQNSEHLKCFPFYSKILDMFLSSHIKVRL